jgi:dipeptidyl aminopeptidase/acylaminoacyl peptidase
MNNTKENTTAIDIFTVIATLLVIGLPVYGYFKLKPDRIFNLEKTLEEVDNSTENDEPIDEKPPVVDDEEEEEAIKPLEITGYTEELVEIDGQWAYILAPEPLDPNSPPRLVIYNHGSTTSVEENLDEDFKADLLQYGDALTPDNYIFAVSNAHGVNWGSIDSINDNYKMYQYIQENYGIQEKIYMIGFSMGGLPTMNFATQYPELVEKIALLAPTTRSSEWDQDRVNKIKDIDIKIWHGTADVNVGYVYTQNFVNKLKSLGKEVDFVTLEGKTHWDLDTELIAEIVQFFNQSQTSSE